MTHLAVERKISASTQNQALQALLFLYRNVLDVDLPWLENVTRAIRPKHLPVVLSRAEVRSVLAGLQGTSLLVAQLLYGSGLRLTEALRLRVKDLALERSELIVRDGKGSKDRVTVLPTPVAGPLRVHLARLREWFEEQRRQGAPGVSVPGALAAKYPGAATQWGGQSVVPSASLCGDPYSGRPVQKLLGHNDVKMTMIYTHVMGKGARGVKSPLDHSQGN